MTDAAAGAGHTLPVAPFDAPAASGGAVGPVAVPGWDGQTEKYFASG